MATPSHLLPLPSLPFLPNTPLPHKARFLGCIRDYDHHTATATLQHPPSPVIAYVDLALPLASLDMGSLRNGEWISVIGNITEVSEEEKWAKVKAEIVMPSTVGLGGYRKGVGERVRMQRETEEVVRRFRESQD